MEPDHISGYRQNPIFGKLKRVKKNQTTNGAGTMRLMKSSSTNLLCAVCFGINARACQGCYNVAYCCREHQIQHWTIHQPSCRPLVSVQRDEVLQNLASLPEARSSDPYLGMYKAARDLKPLETVLHLQPIMHVAYSKGLPAPPDSNLCLGCNRWYQHSQGYRCSRCKWAVCSEQCELDSYHTRCECKVLFDNKILPPANPTFYNADILLAIRCLMLKQLKPTDWEQLVALVPVVERMVRPRYCIDSDDRIAKYLVYNCRIQDYVGSITCQEIMNILKVIDFCTVWLPEQATYLWDKEYAYVSAKYVFPTKVLIAEVCSPNSSWSLRYSPQLEECSIRVRTSVAIESGQYITANFSGIAEFGATFPRRYEHSRFHCKCKCKRCLDPTEGGTFFSGVRCPVCNNAKEGYLVPEDPSEYNGLWRCFNKACHNTSPGLIIADLVNRVYNEIIENRNTLQGLININENERNRFHRNHYLFMKSLQLSIDLCWGICRNSALQFIAYTLLDKAKVLTEKLANIYKAIYPWNSTENARLLFLFQLLHGIAKVRDLLWLYKGKKYFKDDHRYWGNEFWEILKIQKAALKILLEEPPGTPERTSAICMKGVVEDTESLLLLERRDSAIHYETLISLQKVYSRYCSDYLLRAMPIFEDKELNELVLFTGPFCNELLDKSVNV